MTALAYDNETASKIMQVAFDQFGPRPEDAARPACKTDTIVKRDSMTLVETVILRLGQIAIGGGRDQPTQSTESNENIQRNHITPAVRDDAHVSPAFSTAETPTGITLQR